MQLIPLGTNGFFASFGRQTACFAIPYGKTLIILDAGSGLFRLAEPQGQELLKSASEVHLYLSHYHLDHTFGFYGAFNLLKGKKVNVYSFEGKKVFQELISPGYIPDFFDFDKAHANFSWKKIDEGEYNLVDYKVKVRRQNHRGEVSLAYRLEFKNGKSVAYLTDTEATKESIDFVRGVDLLLHEHEKLSNPQDVSLPLEKQMQSGHVTTVGAAMVAKAAGAGKLALIHNSPFLDEKGLKEQVKIAQKIFPKVNIAKDLDILEF